MHLPLLWLLLVVLLLSLILLSHLLSPLLCWLEDDTDGLALIAAAVGLAVPALVSLITPPQRVPSSSSHPNSLPSPSSMK
jgi:hypothetical protein